MIHQLAVIGGGISGLAAAWTLAQTPGVAVTLYEATDHLGGVLRTERDGDWLIEGGPESFLAMKPRGIGLARELGLEPHFQTPGADTRGSYILRNGRLHRMPDGLTGLIPTSFGPMARTRLVSPLGKLRMALDYVIPARQADDDETMEQFIVRRLGRDVYEHLIEPLAAGIYSGSGQELSMQATYPQLLQAERDHGGLIRGVLAQRRARQARPIGHQVPIGFLSFIDGIQELPNALVAAIESRGGTIARNRPITELRRTDTGFQLTADIDGTPTRIPADGVILATPVHVQANLLQHLDEDAATAMRGIPQVSSAIVMLGYRESATDQAPRNHGYLVPRAEQRAVKAITWMSSKWEHRAPEGHFLVRGFLGRAGEQKILEQDDAGLVQAVRDQLHHQHGIVGEPVLSRVIRCNAASPQYVLGHTDRVRRIEAAAARLPGLQIAGNMLHGVGIPDSIAAGESAAERLLRDREIIASEA